MQNRRHRSEVEPSPQTLATPRSQRNDRRTTGCLALLAGAASAAFAAHLVFSDPAGSAATASVFWAALAGIVAWALKRLRVGAEAVRLIKAVRGK